MLTNISYFPLFGKPLIFYLGILAFVSIFLTALVGFLNYKKIGVVPFRWHPKIALLAIILATIHGLLGILAYF